MVTTALIAGAIACLIAAVGEKLHARKVARVAFLAFGPSGNASPWTRAAPIVRFGSVGALAFGATYLASHDPVSNSDRPVREASQHLLVCLDVSPSMLIEDGGPGPKFVTRSIWAGKLASAILDRLDSDSTRLSLVAFYTEALPVVKETFDKDVIANTLDGLPMYVAFKGGETDLYLGVNEALDMARVWPPDSAVLVVISDGDANSKAGSIRIPESIADSIVIGVGDPYRSTPINGHASRQDATSLKQLAARLGGRYHDGSRKHLPSDIIAGLSVIRPDAADGIGWRTVALLAVAIGSLLLAWLQPVLILLGIKGSFRRARNSIARSISMSNVTAPAVLSEVSHP